ncbi:MAG: CBS domain-containing protein [Proteobacteria bacterium]|nr:CBS domain-containing protein [Pseudomonadota bacterium]
MNRLVSKKTVLKIIAQVMTPAPKSIGPEVSLSKAQEMMAKLKVRHLPVVVGGKVVGLLSDRNAKAASLSKWGEGFLVEDVMISDPFVVQPSESLDSVLSQMMKNKYGSVVVQEKNGDVTGIFTTLDALYVLRNILR